MDRWTSFHWHTLCEQKISIIGQLIILFYCCIVYWRISVFGLSNFRNGPTFYDWEEVLSIVKQVQAWVHETDMRKKAVLRIRNYYFRIRIQLSSQLWIRIQIWLSDNIESGSGSDFTSFQIWILFWSFSDPFRILFRSDIRVFYYLNKKTHFF